MRTKYLTFSSTAVNKFETLLKLKLLYNSILLTSLCKTFDEEK